MTALFTNTVRESDGIALEWTVRGVLPSDIARQLPFAGVLALNRTAQEANALTRTHAATKFRVRGDQGRRFIEQSFQITKYATKASPVVQFGISRALQQGRSGFLIDFEDGTDRVAKGRNNFPYLPAIGSSLRPSINDTLPQWASPRALGLIDRRGIAGETISGADRTGVRRGSKRGLRATENRKAFILRDKGGDPVGIFRRVPLAGARVSATREGGKKLTLRQRRKRGSGQSTLELLFATPKVVPITPRLGFARFTDHVMVERIQTNFVGMLAYLTDERRQASNASFAQADAGLIAAFRGRR